MKKKLRYYVVKRTKGFWQPKKEMREAGFLPIPLGPDGPEAWAAAEARTAEWEKYRREVGRPVNGTPKSDRILLGRARDDHGHIYFVKVEERVKIGFSREPLQRVVNMKTAWPSPPTVILVVRGTRADEAKLHYRLRTFRRHGEWFMAHPTVMRVMMRSMMFAKPMHDQTETDEEQPLEQRTAS